MSLPPAAWHPDPTGRNEYRYWDGERWTEHVANGGQVSVDAVAATAPTAQAQQPMRAQQAVQAQQPVQAQPAQTQQPVETQRPTQAAEPEPQPSTPPQQDEAPSTRHAAEPRDPVEVDAGDEPVSPRGRHAAPAAPGDAGPQEPSPDSAEPDAATSPHLSAVPEPTEAYGEYQESEELEESGPPPVTASRDPRATHLSEPTEPEGPATPASDLGGPSSASDIDVHLDDEDPRERHGITVAAMLVGVMTLAVTVAVATASLLLVFVPTIGLVGLVGVVGGILALGLGMAGSRRARGGAPGRGAARVGIVCGILAILLGLGVLFVHLILLEGMDAEVATFVACLADGGDASTCQALFRAELGAGLG